MNKRGIFVDTGIFAAFSMKRDPYHKNATKIVEQIVKGEYGPALTSDYIYTETLTLVLKRTKRCDVALNAAAIFSRGTSKKWLNLIKITSELSETALEKFRSYCEDEMSFTDCTSLVVLEKYGLGRIATFDQNFKGKCITVGI